MAISGPKTRNPELANQYLAKANAFVDQDHLDDAFLCYQQGIEADDRNADCWFGMGRHCYINNNGSLAFQYIDRAVLLVTLQGEKLRDLAKFEYLGLCYKDGIGTNIDPQKAIEYFRRALEGTYKALAKLYPTAPEYLTQSITRLTTYIYQAYDPKHYQLMGFGYTPSFSQPESDEKVHSKSRQPKRMRLR